MSGAKQEERKPFLPQGKYLKPEEIEYEFGGMVGVIGMLVGFPALMYYMWLSAEFYKGKPAWPADGESWGEFLCHLVELVKEHGIPSVRTWGIFFTFWIAQVIFYYTCLLYTSRCV